MSVWRCFPPTKVCSTISSTRLLRKPSIHREILRNTQVYKPRTMDDDQQSVKRIKHSHDRELSKIANVPPHVPESIVGEKFLDQTDAANSTGFISSSHTDTNTPPAEQTVPASAETPTLSKRQLKKLRKAQEWEAGKDNRKAKRKQKIQEKKVRKREERARVQEERKAQGLDPTPEKKPSQKFMRLPVTFLIDCGFDDKMDDNERISLGSQITRAYSDNSKATIQANLCISSWNGLLKERFDTILSKQHQNWKKVTFTSEDFVAAARQAACQMETAGGNKFAGIFEKYLGGEGQPQQQPSGYKPEADDAQDVPEGSSSYSDGKIVDKLGEGTVAAETQQDQQRERLPADPSPETISNLKQQGEIVYLTSDSPNTLTELKPYSTYIIGGLVDKNRYKGLCYQVACDRKIATAKLPIGHYMQMQSRFVLATNHVVEIMIRYLECGDWGEAFMKVIPKRKGGKLKGDGGNKIDAPHSEDCNLDLEIEKQPAAELADSTSVSRSVNTDQSGSHVHQNSSSASSFPS